MTNAMRLSLRSAAVLVAALSVTSLAWAQDELQLVYGRACLNYTAPLMGTKIQNNSPNPLTGLTVYYVHEDGFTDTTSIPSINGSSIADTFRTFSTVGKPIVTIVGGPRDTFPRFLVDDFTINASGGIFNDCPAADQRPFFGAYIASSSKFVRGHFGDEIRFEDSGPLVAKASTGQYCKWNPSSTPTTTMIRNWTITGSNTLTTLTIPGGQIGCTTLTLGSEFHVTVSPANGLQSLTHGDEVVHRWVGTPAEAERDSPSRFPF